MLNINYFDRDFSTLSSFEEFFYNKENNAVSLEMIKKTINTQISALNKEENISQVLLLKAPIASGKSHLLEAIAKKLHLEKSNIKIALGNVSGLISLFSKKEDYAEEIKKFQYINAFLIDDIHILAQHTEIQNEFIQLLDYLIKRKIFIVMTTLSHNDFIKQNSYNHTEIKEFSPALSSRLSACITIHLKLPDIDTRMRYVQSQYEKNKISLSKSMCLEIARYSSDMRKLQGIIQTTITYIKSHEGEFNEEELINFIQNFKETRIVSPELIIAHTAHYFNLKADDLKGKSRIANIVRARQISMYLCRKLLAFSYPQIAEIYGGKDHTTVIHACSKVEKDEALQGTINVLSQKISQDMPLL